MSLDISWLRGVLEEQIAEAKQYVDKQFVADTASCDINAVKVDWWNNLSRVERLAQTQQLEDQLATCSN